MKHIIKNFFQKIARHMERLVVQSAVAEPESNLHPLNAGRFFTINTHWSVGIQYLFNGGKELQLFGLPFIQNTAMEGRNPFDVNRTNCSKYIPITPKKKLFQSYSIMVGGVLT